jgi:hypothetical protein
MKLAEQPNAVKNKILHLETRRPDQRAGFFFGFGFGP